MATDFSAELRGKILPGSRLTIRPDLGFAAAGNGRVDRQQGCRFSDIGPSSSAVLTATKEGIESKRADKIRRVERFGIPVRLSEAEKRFSRAERFELLTLSMSTDEEAKKKARLARFAPFS
ncbi:Protein MODIFIER OF SNC1 11, partial [Cucurbita argyrosperma subsp. argyrosperma]